MENAKQAGAFEMVAELKPNEFVDSRGLVANAFTSWMPPEGVAMKITNPGRIAFDMALEALT